MHYICVICKACLKSIKYNKISGYVYEGLIIIIHFILTVDTLYNTCSVNTEILELDTFVCVCVCLCITVYSY